MKAPVNRANPVANDCTALSLCSLHSSWYPPAEQLKYSTKLEIKSSDAVTKIIVAVEYDNTTNE